MPSLKAREVPVLAIRTEQGRVTCHQNLGARKEGELLPAATGSSACSTNRSISSARNAAHSALAAAAAIRALTGTSVGNAARTPVTTRTATTSNDWNE